MYILGVSNVMDMPFNRPNARTPLKYGDIFKQTEEEYSRWNFDIANTETLFRQFDEAEQECLAILSKEKLDPKSFPIIYLGLLP